jgi:hypothetical protein
MPAERPNINWSVAEQKPFSGVMKPEGQTSPAPRNGEFVLPQTQQGSNEVSQTDLRLLGYYSLLSGMLDNYYPQDMSTSVAPPMDKQILREKVNEAHKGVISSPPDELSTEDRQRARRDFRRVTKKVNEIEATPQEERPKLLERRKYQKEKKYLGDQTLEHLHKLR